MSTQIPIVFWMCLIVGTLMIGGNAVFGEDAADLHKRGIEALKESQTNPGAIVTAARCFAKASALYESSGKADLAVEMNSFLYWCKKKMTLADIDAFLKVEDAATSKRLTSVEKKPITQSDAQTSLALAEAFARANPSEHLLIAVRFFEVADRFKESDAGRSAMGRSLSEMQQAVSEKSKKGSFNPVGMWSQMRVSGEVILDFRADKSLVFTERGNRPVGGTWELTDGVILHFQNEWGQSTCRITDADSFVERENNVFKRKRIAEVGAGERQRTPGGKAIPNDGQAFIRSDPVGAAILLVSADGSKIDTGKTTPATVRLPLGRVEILLALNTYKDTPLSIDVDAAGICKPDIVKLAAITVPVDVVFEEGWHVFVDSKPAIPTKGKAETPCTVEIPLGSHEIGVAKRGFADLKQTEKITGHATIEIHGKPSPGTGTLLWTMNLMPEMKATVAGCTMVETADGAKLTREPRTKGWFEWHETFTPPFKVEVYCTMDSVVNVYCGERYISMRKDGPHTGLDFWEPVNGRVIGVPCKVPINTDTWFKITWTVTDDLNTVAIDDRPMFAKRTNSKGLFFKVGVGPASGSTVLVKNFTASPLQRP